MEEATIKYYHNNEGLILESGERLPRFQLAYHTYGKLNDDRSNVVWIIHALTADSNAAEWWPGMIGPGLAIDTDKYFVVCANTLGSHYGSTSPLSTDPITDVKYHHRFPRVTNRDIVQSFVKLAEYLDISTIHSLIGPSLGGQQALEWAVMFPSQIKNLLLIATNAVHSPYGIAFNESQRLAIEADATWLTDRDDAGAAGMKAARSLALLSYRTRYGYNISQKRASTDKLNEYKAASYQRYQGEKLVRRFNAYSYYLLSQVMDSHDLSRGRGSLQDSLSKVTAQTTVIGIDSDILFPIEEQKTITDHIIDSQLYIISSDYGHDGFLTEINQMTTRVSAFLDSESRTTFKTALSTVS